MRRIDISATNNRQELISILFFAQLLDELVFDHSDDSYKAPALNTFSRRLELRRLARLNDEASIGSSALEAFVDELEWSIKNDEVLDSRKKSICHYHVKVIRSNMTTPDRIDRSITAITLSLGDYFEDCISKLKNLITSSPNEKKKIANLAATFVAQLEVEGFSRRYCYHIKQKLVRKLQTEILLDIQATTENFFKAFTNPEQEYNVTLLATKNIERFKEVAQYFLCEIQKLGEHNLDPRQHAHREFKKTADPDSCCVIFSKVRAREPIEARDNAVSLFNLFIASIGFQYHDLKIELGPLALVSDGVRLHINVGTSPDPMHRNKKNPVQINTQEIREFAEVLFGAHLTPLSTRRFINAVEFHRAALRSSIEHHQLVDLWAALEGLLPPPGKDSPRIRFFVANLVAPLCLTYPEKLFRQVLDEISTAETGLMDKVLSLPSGNTPLEKITLLITCSEFKEIQDKIAEDLAASNPLLMYRIWELSERFKSAKATRETLLSHRKKVAWHIERIYSTRNSIMHNAEALPYLGTLVENLHGYVDSLLSSIARVAINANTQTSINTALEHILAHEADRLVELEQISRLNPGNECTTENAVRVIFGSTNPLRPAY